MDFDLLVNTIQKTHSTLQQSGLKSINKHLTIRNWLVGFYIVEFEQKGEDRAKYGEKLLDVLADSINSKGLSARNLKLFRQFYNIYPQIGQTVSDQLKQLGLGIKSILPLPVSVPIRRENQLLTIVQTPSAQLQNLIARGLQVPPNKLINHLSFSQGN